MQVAVGGTRLQQSGGGGAVRLEGGPVGAGVGGDVHGSLGVLVIEQVQLAHVRLQGPFGVMRLEHVQERAEQVGHYLVVARLQLQELGRGRGTGEGEGGGRGGRREKRAVNMLLKNSVSFTSPVLAVRR